MSREIPMQLPYGAVYFRKSNPPKEDWERDYAQAAKDGFNIFRHWFMWGAIEIAPGVYDWEDYDRQMELAEKYGIKTIIAEIITCVPDWVFTRYPEAIAIDSHGNKAKNQMGVSCAVGGFYDGVCLDTTAGKELAGRFLRELTKRYKNHPALLGYDVWNECNSPHDFCFCEETIKAFRTWLQKKYNSLDRLKKAWYRYSLTEWEDIQPPPVMALYPECFDWLEFKKMNSYQQMKWRVDLIREIDPECLISAHGTAQSLENMAVGCSDEWMSAKEVELYGFTFVQSRKGAESFKQFCAVDLTRSGAKEKPFWHAEAQGGPLWLQPQVTGREREDGRITEPEDIRLWNLTTFAGGTRGLLYPRWRPLLDGPLFGAFGAYGMDGLPTPRSEMASSLAKWTNAPEQSELLKASPIRGEIGIIILPESQSATFLLSRFGAKDQYREALMGVYRAFYDMNIQADFVHVNDIEAYEKLYLPIPAMLSNENADKIAKWVCAGGYLFSEGCPGYFQDHGKVCTTQPGSGLDQVFGVKEEYVEFTQDILMDEYFSFEGQKVLGGEYWQTYKVTTGRELFYDAKNRCCAVENTYGKGTAVLVGTCPSLGYWKVQDKGQKFFFQKVSEWLNIEQHVCSSHDQIKVRMQKKDQKIYVWILNTARERASARLRFSEKFNWKCVETIFWNGGDYIVSNQSLEVNIEGRNALILELR